MRARSALLGIGVVVSGAVSPAHGLTIYGGSYLSQADSPFDGWASTYFHLEDFEDGALNTQGVGGAGFNQIAAPSTTTDSVDGDDGAIDGSGTAGRSLYMTGTTVEFTFDAGALGSLPSFAGIVWTDVGFVTPGKPTGYGDVHLEVFDSADQSIFHFWVAVGDGVVTGGTAEDQFLGISSDVGIARMVVWMPDSTDWEVDHLQYGYIPTPATVAVLGAGSLAAIRRRRTI